MLEYPVIDPVALQIGPVLIRWYSLAYIVGIVGGWLLIGRMNKRSAVLKKEQYDALMTYGILGIILGGRLGYVLFYNLPHFIQHPSEILMVWQGGMSFHGGMLGTIFAILLFSRIHKVEFFKLMDMMAAVAPIGILLGRLANFVNGELFGRVTDSPFGMVFPHGGPEPRYPSQLFEAATEGLLLFIVLTVLFWVCNSWKKPGLICGAFLLVYGLGRIFSEHFREPDVQIGYFAGGITMGQILSIPMIIYGLYLIFNAKRKYKQKS